MGAEGPEPKSHNYANSMGSLFRVCAIDSAIPKHPNPQSMWGWGPSESLAYEEMGGVRIQAVIFLTLGLYVLGIGVSVWAKGLDLKFVT